MVRALFLRHLWYFALHKYPTSQLEGVDRLGSGSALLGIVALVMGSLANGAAADNLSSWSLEANGDASYVGPSELNNGHKAFGSFNEWDSTLNVVASNQVSQNTLLRFGMNWQRFSFTPDAQAPVPGSLQSLNLEIGADYQLTPVLLLRVEAQPGFYSDFRELRQKDFNIPFVVGATYLSVGIFFVYSV